MNHTCTKSIKSKGIAYLSYWGQVTYICVGNLDIIGSDNGLSPGRRHAIIWTNARILLIWPLGTNFSEILIVFLRFSSRKCMSKFHLWKCGHFVSASMCCLPYWLLQYKTKREHHWSPWCFSVITIIVVSYVLGLCTKMVISVTKSASNKRNNFM